MNTKFCYECKEYLHSFGTGDSSKHDICLKVFMDRETNLTFRVTDEAFQMPKDCPYSLEILVEDEDSQAL